MRVSTVPVRAGAPDQEPPVSGMAPRSDPSPGVRRPRAGVFVWPALILLLVFQAVPFALSVFYSFTNQRLLSPRPARFIGTSNYEYLVTDPVFHRAVTNSLTFTVIAVPILTGLALGLALLLDSRLRGIGVFRVAVFAPVVMVAAVSATIWRLLFAEDAGLINGVLAAVLPGFEPRAWLDDPSTALGAVMVMFVWRYAGFMMVIFLAALQGVPQELLESARLDGANRLKQFRYVILPSIRNTTVFVVTISAIFALRLFDEVYIATDGGPLNATTTFLLHLVKVGFNQQRVGEASAVAIVFVLVSVAVAVLIRLIGRERREVD